MKQTENAKEKKEWEEPKLTVLSAKETSNSPGYGGDLGATANSATTS